jgi:hypothetical protein
VWGPGGATRPATRFLLPAVVYQCGFVPSNGKVTLQNTCIFYQVYEDEHTCTKNAHMRELSLIWRRHTSLRFRNVYFVRVCTLPKRWILPMSLVVAVQRRDKRRLSAPPNRDDE